MLNVSHLTTKVSDLLMAQVKRNSPNPNPYDLKVLNGMITVVLSK